MLAYRYQFVLLCLTTVAVLSGKKPVILKVVTAKNFNSTVGKHERVVVAFCAECISNPQNGEEAPWCDPCRKFNAEFNELAAAIEKQRLKTRLVQGEVFHDKELQRRFKISFTPDQSKGEKMPAFPLVFYYFRGKQFSAFKGKHKDKTSLLDWLSIRERQAISVLQEDEFETYLNKTKMNEFAVVARVKDRSPRATTFWSAMEFGFYGYDASLIRIAAVHLPTSADGNRDAAIVMWRPGFKGNDARETRYSGKWSEDTIIKWVKKKTYPSIGSKFDVRKYGHSALKDAGLEAVAVLILDDQTSLPASEILSACTKDFPSWRFVYTRLDSLDDDALQLLGVGKTEVPTFVVLFDRRRYKLESDEGIQDSKTISKFLADVKARKALPHFRSEPPPIQTLIDGITVLTGDTFESSVMNERHDVFVAFYLGGCQKYADVVEPAFKLLGKKVINKGWDLMGVTLATIDVGKNDCREDFSSYPKLVLYPAVTSERKTEMKQVYPPKYDLASMTRFLIDYARNLKGVKVEL